DRRDHLAMARPRRRGRAHLGWATPAHGRRPPRTRRRPHDRPHRPPEPPRSHAMSITNSLYIGISGLQAHGEAISVVGDNIANASTIGYKRNRAGFADMLGGELNAQRMGGGVRLSGTQTMWEQGAVTQTGNSLDLAVRGGGLFVVKGSH